MATEYRVKRGEKVQTVSVVEDRGETVLVEIDGQRLELAVHALPDGRTAVASAASASSASRRVALRAIQTKQGLLVVDAHAQRTFEVEDARVSWLAGAGAGKGAAGGRVTASMPGRVVRMPVKLDEIVPPGGVVAVLEAMKMENDVKAPGGGKVVEIAVKEGMDVEAGALLVRLEPVHE